MTIGKKSIAVFLVIVLIVLGLDLAVRFFFDIGPLKTRITTELATRLQADVEIDRIDLNVLPRPQLALHNVQLVFADGTALRIPLVGLSPTFAGLFAGKPAIASIRCEKPDVRIAVRQQEPEADNRTPEARQKDLALLIESALKAIPRIGVIVHDGTVHITAPDGSPLVLENIAAEAVATLQGVRIAADCTSALWKNLAIELSYHDPEVILELDARDIDIAKSNRMFTAFAGEDLPAANITQSLSGLLGSVSLKAILPRASDPLAHAVISGRGSFENMSIDLPDGLDVRKLEGDFDLDNASITATGISAHLGKSRIQEAAIHLDRARGFKPSRISAEFNLDLSEVPGLLRVIPDPGVRGEIALIKDPQGTAVGTFELRAERDSYSTEIAVKKLLLQSGYRAFPPPLELSRGMCTYRDGLLSFKGFSGKLGSSILPDFSLSFGLRDDQQFTAAAQGATIDLVDLRMALSSFDSSRKLIETITAAGGRLQVHNLSLKGPLTEPESWTIAVDAQLDAVSVTAAGFDGPLAVSSGMLKADRKACTLSQAAITYLDARLAGSCTFKGYFGGPRTVTADVNGTVGKKMLASAQSSIDMPSVVALRPPLRIENTRFAWTRGGAITVAGDFVLGGSSKAGLNLRVDDKAIEIKELRIRDAASKCRIGMKIEEDLVAVTYAGMLKKETLDRVLLENPFLQGWIQGDFSATFNQKKPRSSSATGTLSWEKAGYPAVDALPVNISSAVITARNNRLVFDSAHLSAGQDSAGMHGSVSFTDDAFTLEMNISADSIDLDAFKNLLSTDNASSQGSADEFWETPLRGTLKLASHEIKKNPFTCAPFNTLFSFGDKAVTIKTGGTKLCGIDVPAEMRITPGGITLEAQPRAMHSSLQEVFQCLTGEKSIMTGSVDIEGSVRSQGKPAALLDSLGGNFLITARDGRIYKSGVLLKILSFLSIQNLLSGDIVDMAKKGYAYQSLHVTAAVAGQTVQVQKAILVSSSLTLVCKGTINFETRQIDLEALATPFQIQNQLLSKVPLVGDWLSKPVLGVPLKISGTFDDPKISTRTTSAVTKGLMDITKGIIQAPIRIIEPVFRKEPSGEQ